MVAAITSVFNNWWHQEKLISKLSNAKLNDALVAQIIDIWLYTEPFTWWWTVCKIRPLGLRWDFAAPVPTLAQLSAVAGWLLPTRLSCVLC